jgi:hypothetical protein
MPVVMSVLPLLRLSPASPRSWCVARARGGVALGGFVVGRTRGPTNERWIITKRTTPSARPLCFALALADSPRFADSAFRIEDDTSPEWLCGKVLCEETCRKKRARAGGSPSTTVKLATATLTLSEDDDVGHEDHTDDGKPTTAEKKPGEILTPRQGAPRRPQNHHDPSRFAVAMDDVFAADVELGTL